MASFRCIISGAEKGRIISVTIVQILLPIAIVILCYLFIFTYVCRIARTMQDQNLILQKEIRITKMFGIIFLMILLGFFPYSVIRNIDRQNTLNADLYVVVTVFYGIATCSNPLIYGFMSTDLRKECLKLCGTLGLKSIWCKTTSTDSHFQVSKITCYFRQA